MKIQDLLDAFLVLQDLLHAGFLEGRVAGREQGDVAKMADGAHDLPAEISYGLVKLIHRPVLLFLDLEETFLYIGNRTLGRFLRGFVNQKKNRKKRKGRKERITATEIENLEKIDVFLDGEICEVLSLRDRRKTSLG